jgi:hypothetical protein
MNNHIKISDVTPRIQYAADGSQTQFSYPFPIFVEDDLEVYTGDNKEISGYSVLGAGTSYGGSVTFDTPPASGVVVTLRRSLAIDRTTDFQQSGAFRAKDINDELDYLTAALQQVANDVGRAVRLSSTDEDADLQLPSKDERTNKVLGFDASGDVIATSGSGGSGGGVTDHGQLTGLSDDDHNQYHNDARGDARYYTQAVLDAGQLDGRYYTETEVDSKFSGLGSAAALDAGTAVDDLLQLENVGGTPGLPAVDASQLTGLPSGVSDHGALTGLTDDDHSQYHNDTRGDARYLKPTDIATGTITARSGAIDLSGGSDGDVLTVQADGSLAPETPAAGSGEANITGDQGGGQSILADTPKTGATLYFKTFAVDTGFTLDDTGDLITIAFDTTASPQLTGLNLGHATDTTLTRSAAGVLAVEGNDVVMIGGSQAVLGVRSDVLTSVSGSLTTAAHSGAILVTSGNVTVPNASGDVGFNAVIIAGGAHTVTFNSLTSAAMAAGDIMTIAVQSTSVIKAVLTASANMVSFS